MIGLYAVEYAPYFDVYPNPPLTDNSTDIRNGSYGSGSSAITSNYNWGVYAGKLALGQGVFETALWSNTGANSITTTNPWYPRGGYSGNTTNAGVESIGSLTNGTGGSITYVGFRPLVLGWTWGG